MFSGGAASSVVAEMVARRFPADTILLHTPTYGEHPDADRFRAQVAAHIGLPITVAADGRTIWELIRENRWFPNNLRGYCTETLKKRPAKRFLKALGGPYTVYYGFGRDEAHRVLRQRLRYAQEGVEFQAPLHALQIPDDFVFRVIRDDWKICLPEPYKYMTHNNCIPCYKAGMKHWYDVLTYYPDYYRKAVLLEIEIGRTMFKDISLMSLAAKWAKDPPRGYEEKEQIPCMCANGL